MAAGKGHVTTSDDAVFNHLMEPEPGHPETIPAKLHWLLEYDQAALASRPAQETRPAANAVERDLRVCMDAAEPWQRPSQGGLPRWPPGV